MAGPFAMRASPSSLTPNPRRPPCQAPEHAFGATACRPECSCRYARCCRRHRDGCPGAARPAALGAVSHSRHRRALHHLGSRRAGGDDRRFDRRRAAFGIGAVLGLGILFLRRWIPESPRWLMLHARPQECEAVLCGIEERVLARPGAKPLAEAGARLRLVAASHTPILRMIRAILRDYPRRAVLGLVLMASQAFFYNAIFFSYALVLTRFYAVPS